MALLLLDLRLISGLRIIFLYTRHAGFLHDDFAHTIYLLAHKIKLSSLLLPRILAPSTPKRSVFAHLCSRQPVFATTPKSTRSRPFFTLSSAVLKELCSRLLAFRNSGHTHPRNGVTYVLHSSVYSLL